MTDKKPYIMLIHFYGMSTIDKYTQTKYAGAMKTDRDFQWVSLGADKNVLELEGAVGIQPCEYISITALYILHGSYWWDIELCHNKNM